MKYNNNISYNNPKNNPKMIQNLKNKRILSLKLKEWSKIIRERDKCCFVCGSTEHLQAHHILPKKMFKDCRFDPDVGITLCRCCHTFGRLSIHHGAGCILLIPKLQSERPQQFKKLISIVNQYFNPE